MSDHFFQSFEDCEVFIAGAGLKKNCQLVIWDMQVLLLGWQVTFHSHLPDGQEIVQGYYVPAKSLKEQTKICRGQAKFKSYLIVPRVSQLEFQIFLKPCLVEYSHVKYSWCFHTLIKQSTTEYLITVRAPVRLVFTIQQHSLTQTLLLSLA